MIARDNWPRIRPYSTQGRIDSFLGSAFRFGRLTALFLTFRRLSAHSCPSGVVAHAEWVKGAVLNMAAPDLRSLLSAAVQAVGADRPERSEVLAGHEDFARRRREIDADAAYRSRAPSRSSEMLGSR